MKIAVVGCGAVGGYFGARLAEAGTAVVFVARNATLEAVRREGIHVESIAGDVSIHPAEVTSIEAAPAVDAVVIAVKTWQLGDVARNLGALLGPETFVLPLQNGVEAADELAAAVGPHRVLGGMCRILSRSTAPGRIHHAGAAPSIAFGERDGTKSDRVIALAERFAMARGVVVDVPEDIDAAVWEKLLFVGPVGAVGAAAGSSIGVVRTTTATRDVLAQAMAEVGAVARARGVRLRSDAVERALAYVDALPADATASMQRDLADGRRSELDSQVGAIVRLGKAAGVPVPVHAVIHACLLARELRAGGRDGP